MAVKQYYPVFFSFRAFWHKSLYFSVLIQGYVRLRKQNSHSIYIYYYYILYILPYSQQLGLYTCSNHLVGKGFFPVLVLYDVIESKYLNLFCELRNPAHLLLLFVWGRQSEKIWLGMGTKISCFLSITLNWESRKATLRMRTKIWSWKGA